MFRSRPSGQTFVEKCLPYACILEILPAFVNLNLVILVNLAILVVLALLPRWSPFGDFGISAGLKFNKIQI